MMILIILKMCLFLYIIHVCSVILHEMGHVLIAHVLHLQVNKVCIGCEKYSLKIGKIQISPFVANGYVEIAIDNCTVKKSDLMMFFMAGPLINLMIVIGSFFMTHITINAFFVIGINLIHFCGSICPWIEGNDVVSLIKELKQLN